MPTISFPSNPSLNDTYSFGGKTWIYNGAAWDLQSTGSINGIPVGNGNPSTGSFTTLTSTDNTSLGKISSDLIPFANLAYSLGNATNQWANIYVGGNTIYLGDLQLKDTGGNTFGVYAADGTTPATLAGNVTASDVVGTVANAAYALQASVADAANAVAGANVTGTVATANYVTEAAQGNITSVGTLTSLDVTGNVSTSQYFIGNGSQLTGIQAGGTTTVSATPPGSPSQGDVWIDTNTGVQFIYFNDGNSSQWAEMEAEQSFYYSYSSVNEVAGSTGQIQYNSSGNFAASSNLTFDGTTLTTVNLAGTLTTAAQPNITSVGTLTSLTVNGPTTHTGNIDITGNINVTGNLNYENVTDLVVGDPLIYIGEDNAGNVFDLGLVVSWTDSIYQHGGWVRDASDGTWKLFGNVVPEPTTTVDFTNATWQPMQAGAITAIGNITGTNFSTTGLLSATGNITGGNINTAGSVSATGNVTAATVIPTYSLNTKAIVETITVTAAAPTATTNFDAITQSIQYYTSNANTNFTLNIRGNSTVSMNTFMSTGQSLTVVLLVTNGATPYYANVIQVDGNTVTPKWQGGTAVTSGNANSIDSYTFTLIKTGANTFTVLGSQTKFA